MTRNEKEAKFRNRIAAAEVELEHWKDALRRHQAAGDRNQAELDRVFLNSTLEELQVLNDNYLRFLLAE